MTITKQWLVLGVVLCGPLSGALAVTATVPEGSAFYYELGGAEAVTRPANATVTTLTLGSAADWNVGLSCGRFDAAFSVGQTLNDIASGAERMMAQVVGAARAAIAALPALILQRANPGLYDLLQNGLDLGRFQLELATKSCKQMEAEMAAGKNPFDGWMTLAKANGWRAAIGSGVPSIVDADTAIERAGGDGGLPWTGGRRAGGLRQAPIRVVSDVAVAGANLTLGRAAHAAGPFPPSAEPARLQQIWTSSESVREWATAVLGDQLVRTETGASRESVPGHGLLPVVERHRVRIAEHLTALVTTEGPVTVSALESLAAPGTAITREALEAIRDLTPAAQAVVLGKLAAEIALARTLEEALLMRRALLTGKREPNVANAGLATTEVERVVGELESEIEGLLFESRVRREVVSGTLARVLAERDRREAEGLRRATGTYVDPNPVGDDGAVKQ